MAKKRQAAADGSASRKSKRLAELHPENGHASENGHVLLPEPANGVPATGEKSEMRSGEDRFIGEPVPAEEARVKWPHRYQEQDEEQKGKINGVSKKGGCKSSEEDEVPIQARCHYTQCVVDEEVHYGLFDDAHVMADDGADPYICRIVEMFEAVDGKPYVTCQWYYRAEDTDINEHWQLIDKRRVFLSEVKDDNPLNCLIKKLKIVKVSLGAEKKAITCDYYYDMKYLLPYSSFIKVPEEDVVKEEVPSNSKSPLLLLDMYAGCGAMSTGLCIGSKLSGSNLVTKWAVDLNESACESLRWNHPETEVRNEAAANFLTLLKEWRRLCATFSVINESGVKKYSDLVLEGEEEVVIDAEEDSTNSKDSENFEVDEILDICYGDPKKTEKNSLYLKIRWKGYGPDEDSWEPIDGLSNCGNSIKDFVVNGYNSKRLPLPGDVDIVCGGPPCQGISGFNRFRNTASPLDDPKNNQLIVFMDIVDYLKPRFVLMENVVDILKFKDGYLGGYALGRLIGMDYQARTGILAAGCYGLPQFRMRVFLWGARYTEILPQYPLPTHDVVTRGGAPVKYEKNLVAYDEGHKVELKKKLLLKDAISDLPPVTNSCKKDEMCYSMDPQTDFQTSIRTKKEESGMLQDLLYDHRALPLNTDDYERVKKIPKRKGANFRDLSGVLVGNDKRVYFDPKIDRVLLPSGNPLVPTYAMRFEDGTSPKPFGRLWWDETVPTVVTRAQPHNQRILHPEQDRVLTIRENARLQESPTTTNSLDP
uniref:DNA (cytosine-5-)-methyltransferase n=1 Tax=Kalanchoe fedtschenkoi TaxID=63787 RepID=A0A7N0V2P6_KALFE